MTWLITGGAGYIGAHVVRAFEAAGIEVVVLDNLSTGREAFLPEGVSFVRADILDTEAVVGALGDHAATGVVHCAGYTYVGESVAQPILAWTQNVEGTNSVLAAMEEVGVRSLVFASSAAVYGSPSVETVTEDTPPSPESPCGDSILTAETLVRGQVAASSETDSPLVATSLRCVNVIGSATPDVWDVSPHDLLPRAFGALIDGRAPVINGADYPTPDGTCVHDFVDVADVALVFVEAARALMAGRALAPVYTLGSGVGTSVRQVMDTVIEVTGTALRPTVGPRRPGDPARIVASGERAQWDLGWSMRHTLRDSIASAWAAATSAAH